MINATYQADGRLSFISLSSFFLNFSLLKLGLNDIILFATVSDGTPGLFNLWYERHFVTFLIISGERWDFKEESMLKQLHQRQVGCYKI